MPADIGKKKNASLKEATQEDPMSSRKTPATLSDLRTACEASDDLKPYWRGVLSAGLFLVMVMKNTLGDAADSGKREPDTKRKLKAMTRKGVVDMKAIYRNWCARLFARLDKMNIPHPPTINIYALLALYSGIRLPKSK
jgi:hypothetical protein